jgi:hypothetical protein
LPQSTQSAETPIAYKRVKRTRTLGICMIYDNGDVGWLIGTSRIVTILIAHRMAVTVHLNT